MVDNADEDYGGGHQRESDFDNLGDDDGDARSHQSHEEDDLAPTDGDGNGDGDDENDMF